MAQEQYRTDLFQSHVLKKLGYNIFSRYIWIDGEFKDAYEYNQTLISQEILNNSLLPDGIATANSKVHVFYFLRYFKDLDCRIHENETGAILEIKKLNNKEPVLIWSSIPGTDLEFQLINTALEYLTIGEQFTKIK